MVDPCVYPLPLVFTACAGLPPLTSPASHKACILSFYDGLRLSELTTEQVGGGLGPASPYPALLYPE